MTKRTPPPRHPDDLTAHAEAARSRLRAQDRRRRHARLAEQAMSLVAFYGPRPLRLVPLAEVLGRWAA